MIYNSMMQARSAKESTLEKPRNLIRDQAVTRVLRSFCHLLLDQRQVVQRLEYEVLALVGAWMTRDHLRSA